MNTIITVSTRRSQRGLSLVELMVALIIALVLLAGVIQLYVGTATTSRVQQGLSRVQENARFALDMMARDVRMAGHSGCGRGQMDDLDITRMANDADPDFISSGRHVWGVNDANAEAATSDFWLNGKPSDLDLSDGPDLPDSLTNPAFRVTFASGQDIRTQGGSFKGSNFNITSNNLDFVKNDFITITDCETLHIAEITNSVNDAASNPNITHAKGTGSSGGGNAPHNWNSIDQTYGEGDARAMRYHSFTYYIAENGRGNPALFRRDDMRRGGQAETVELVDNVAAMRVEYGTGITDSEAQVQQYETADEIDTDDWPTVGSVRVSLLLRSDSVIGQDRDRTFNLLGQGALNFDDGRVYQVATRTIALRNVLP